MKAPAILVLTVLACACSVPAEVESASGQQVRTVRPAAVETAGPTRIFSHVDAMRLRSNSGVTLQWIDWDARGQADVIVASDGVYRLSAGQTGTDGARLSLNGAITEIGENYFVLDGTIAISDTPDAGRKCLAHRKWRFEVTQGRKYYRMRTFEWCDGLTDYIDIYF